MRFPELHDLFAQLGLPSDEASVSSFISEHRIPSGTPLEEASFWNPSQAAFLREAVLADSEWAGPADILNSSIRTGLRAPNTLSRP